MAAIYKIVNTVNDKLYIGKTESSLEIRFGAHVRDSKRRSSENRPLYRAFNKYGADKFYIELIEFTDFPEEREIFWIDYYNTYRKGYNATLGGDGRAYVNKEDIVKLHSSGLSSLLIAESLGYSFSTVNKVIASNNLVPHPHQHRSRTNKILCVETGEIFNSQKEAATSIKPHLSKPEIAGVAHKIGLVCKGSRRKAYGFTWQYQFSECNHVVW